MTISPPSKVAPESLKPLTVLASGVDSLLLAIDVTWEDDSFFQYLGELKKIAQAANTSTAVCLPGDDRVESLLFLLKPHGSEGYEWVLNGRDYSMSIGNWLEPISRPSIYARIHSEALWSLGPEEAVEILLTLLNNAKASFEIIKISRIDLCVDLLLPPSVWNMRLFNYSVTRAAHSAIYFRHHGLTGLTFGRDKVVARLYDKPREIVQKSKKTWMYDVWGIPEAPENLNLIRVEVQFRRQGLKELGLNTFTDFTQTPDNLWAYFTRNWLKFQNNPDKHHTKRKPLPFWKVVTNGFLGVQDALPLIRCKAIQTKKKQQFAQAAGLLTSLVAMEHEERDMPLGSEATIDDSLRIFKILHRASGQSEFEFSIGVDDKRAKYHQARKKMVAAQETRAALGFPCNLPIETPNRKNR